MTATLHRCPWCDHTTGNEKAHQQHITEQHIGPHTRDHLDRVLRKRSRK